MPGLKRPSSHESLAHATDNKNTYISSMNRDDSHSTQGEDQHPAKKPRGFVAQQACETCRARKTRCDEDLPCGMCHNLGIECIYGTRKGTKNEPISNSISQLLDALSSQLVRVESKVDRISLQIPTTPTFDLHEPFATLTPHPDVQSTIYPFTTPQAQESCVSVASPEPSATISFSAHQTLHWPPIQSLLPLELARTSARYACELELERLPLQTELSTDEDTSKNEDWLSKLSLTSFKHLSNAYFDTFNRIYPIIDREFYFSVILGKVVRDGFDRDTESCIVLNVMALGTLGLRAYQQAGFGPETGPRKPAHPTLQQLLLDETLELNFFKEGLNRSGCCPSSFSLQSCQYYLTSAIFFMQRMRPMDLWAMVNHAATILGPLLSFSSDLSEWQKDMQSRVYWTAVLLSTVVGEELGMSQNLLKDWEDLVPLPKFINYSADPNPRRPANTVDDEHYHYHFLAQIAHRIILTRIRHELFNNNPSITLAVEMQHQLDQWRSNLPQPLVAGGTKSDSPEWASPADLVATTMLETRYKVGYFHIGRPFCYKAIQAPSLMTTSELNFCKQALEYALVWPIASEISAKMSAFNPLRFFAAGHMFGQLLIFWALRNSSDSRIHDILPDGHERWCEVLVEYLSSLKDLSPTIAKQSSIVNSLYKPSDCDLDDF